MSTQNELETLEHLVTAVRRVVGFAGGATTRGHLPKCRLPGTVDPNRTQLSCRCGLTELGAALADYDALLVVPLTPS